MLKNAYLVAEIGADTAENDRNLPKICRVAGGRGDGRGARGGGRAPRGGARGARPAVRTFILGRFLFSPFQEQISQNLPAKFLRYVSKSFRFIIVQIVRNGFLLSLL